MKQSTKACSVWWLCGRSYHHVNSVDIYTANNFPYTKGPKAGLGPIKRKWLILLTCTLTRVKWYDGIPTSLVWHRGFKHLAILLYLGFLNPAPLPPAALSSSSVLAERFYRWLISKPRVTLEVFVHLLLTGINSWPTGEAACVGRGCVGPAWWLLEGLLLNWRTPKWLASGTDAPAFDGQTGWHLGEPAWIFDLLLACKFRRRISTSAKKMSPTQNKPFFLFYFFLFTIFIGRLHTTNSGYSGLSVHFLMFLRLQMVFWLYWVLRTSWCVPGRADLGRGSASTERWFKAHCFARLRPASHGLAFRRASPSRQRFPDTNAVWQLYASFTEVCLNDAGLSSLGHWMKLSTCMC